MNSWKALLEGSEEKVATSAILDIFDALSNHSDSDTSLAGGAAGIAIFFHWLNLWKPDRVARELSARLLDQAMEAVAGETMSADLYSGFSGIAWACEHLGYASNRAVDRVLKKHLQQTPWNRDFDLVSGLAGLGVYALERLPERGGKDCAELIVQRLEELAEVTSEGITWRTWPELVPESQREGYENGFFNLGVAHGIPGLIAFLGKARSAGIIPAKTKALLEGAVAWLLKHKLPENFNSTFTTWFYPGVESEPSRCAWCYGDAGLSAALFLAGRCARKERWKQEAIKVALKAMRRDPDDCGVVDAGICHGSAGLGHIWNRMFQQTGEGRFREAARFWFHRTLELREPGRGVAGFLSYAPDGKTRQVWRADAGLLTGAAGIGLALLAAVSNVRPDWDRMLLIS